MQNSLRLGWLLCLLGSPLSAGHAQQPALARWEAAEDQQAIWTPILRALPIQPRPPLLPDSFPSTPLILLTVRDPTLAPFKPAWIDSLLVADLIYDICPEDTGAACVQHGPGLYVRLGDPVIRGPDTALVRVVREVGRPFACPRPQDPHASMYAQESLFTLVRAAATWHVVQVARLPLQALTCSP